ncbi:MAG: hypothetical protein J7574_14195 [Flavobacterium sp.]|uniref:hypothetical protein n=1 Tax=Flavobacterium sp. TaxID=239 RepID=UPI001B1440EF|nr:hypothetical protein [Flavobacterium sp.]MBO9585310.1 hypothetical protein [Flavobacterium sp.]
MKKSIIVSAVFLTFSTLAVKAQEKGKHEINISFSDGTTLGYGESFSSGFSSASLGADLNTRTTYSGNLGFGYRNQISKRIRVGADIVFQIEEIDVRDKNYKFIAKRTDSYMMVMPTMSFSYIKTGWLDFYGSAAAGIIVKAGELQKLNQPCIKDDGIGFAFQVNPVGIRAGKKLGGFAEIGYGYRGYLSIGLNYKF